ncbi:hypothetical protein PFICI_10400 [Pestalotiopsis fici W106-1]|uniref:Uncharacterized protein n=1 Tax=Pestalotiopsis fici (strain W106-1 / CGMCC3.15140) TaxID=1229662 RepID=W3WWS8_PESFW|nr:uncharacterized protein PFICI_10400 [Pestalotiopsis fici W106-1]ETS78338.1 hypothetical protein PFICI_10400 [Pestalotiopsis fici W106-1]
MWSLAIILDFLAASYKVAGRWIKYRREPFPLGGNGPRAPAHHHVAPDLPTHTIFSPANLSPGEKLPLLVWANGFGLSWGLMFGDFLREIASHGYIVIANGTPTGLGMTDETGQLQAIRWATQTSVSGDDVKDIRDHIDGAKIALAGQSKGAIHTYIAASTLRDNPAVKSLGIFNSGLMRRRTRDLALVSGLAASVYYFVGDERDVLFKNAGRDWKLIPKGIPAYFASLPTGHLGTFYEESGGLFAMATVNWLDFELKGDESSKQKLLQAGDGWKIQSRNL